ncbi:MAG TPA: branched-chain amino acid ABC transporter substrate-binding protein [Acidimicrobiales bacterium]|nr:branched-chain amino acid ABC transporter substrate-binding protein [Acidimicrobiales bacterium]
MRILGSPRGARRALRSVAVAAAGAVALAACGSSGSNSGSSSSGGGSTSSGPTYTIAYEGPLSGGNSQLGIYQKFAVQLAINNANAGTTFGKLPFKLKFLPEDDQGSGTQAPTAAQAVIGDNSVMAVVGPAFSGASKAADPLYNQAGIAIVTPSATDPTLQTHGWNNFFRVVADDNAQGPADADYLAKGLKVSSVYAIDDASAYAQGLVGAFDTQATSDGLKVTHETAPGTTQCQAGTGNVQQYGALATKIKSSGAQSVFYAGYYCDFALVAKALNGAGFTGKLLSDDGSESDSFVTQAGSSVAQGVLASCACQDITKNSAAASFVSGYKKLANGDPGLYSGEAYDATNAIISVMKGIGSNVTRSAVISGLHSVNYQGLTKTIQFQSNGNISGTAVYIYKVEGAHMVQLGAVTSLIG